MYKQCVAVLLAAITALSCSVTWAARESHWFEVHFSIPARPFYIIPSEPDWMHLTQTLQWDYPRSTLLGLRKNFDVRHDTSAIEARLETPAYLSNGKDVIALQVRFNGVELDSDPLFRQVLSQEEAARGKRVLLEIDPVPPLGGYRSGDFAGTVMLVFNARAPGQ